MNQHTAQHDHVPSGTIGMKVLRLSIIILLGMCLIEYGCWWASRDVSGRWENDERYLIFHLPLKECSRFNQRTVRGGHLTKRGMRRCISHLLLAG